MDKKSKSMVVVGVILVVIMLGVLIAVIAGKAKDDGSGSGGSGGSGRTGKSLEQLEKNITVNTATPTKGVVTFDNNNLYDELPEISKYPLAVEGRGDVNIEIFTSGEKAGSGDDSWLIDVATKLTRKDIR